MTILYIEFDKWSHRMVLSLIHFSYNEHRKIPCNKVEEFINNSICECNGCSLFSLVITRMCIHSELQRQVHKQNNWKGKQNNKHYDWLHIISTIRKTYLKRGMNENANSANVSDTFQETSSNRIISKHHYQGH